MFLSGFEKKKKLVMGALFYLSVMAAPSSPVSAAEAADPDRPASGRPSTRVSGFLGWVSSFWGATEETPRQKLKKMLDEEGEFLNEEKVLINASLAQAFLDETPAGNVPDCIIRITSCIHEAIEEYNRGGDRFRQELHKKSRCLHKELRHLLLKRFFYYPQEEEREAFVAKVELLFSRPRLDCSTDFVNDDLLPFLRTVSPEEIENRMDRFLELIDRNFSFINVVHLLTEPVCEEVRRFGIRPRREVLCIDAILGILDMFYSVPPEDLSYFSSKVREFIDTVHRPGHYLFVIDKSRLIGLVYSIGVARGGFNRERVNNFIELIHSIRQGMPPQILFPVAIVLQDFFKKREGVFDLNSLTDEESRILIESVSNEFRDNYFWGALGYSEQIRFRNALRAQQEARQGSIINFLRELAGGADTSAAGGGGSGGGVAPGAREDPQPLE